MPSPSATTKQVYHGTIIFKLTLLYTPIQASYQYPQLFYNEVPYNNWYNSQVIRLFEIMNNEFAIDA